MKKLLGLLLLLLIVNALYILVILVVIPNPMYQIKLLMFIIQFTLLMSVIKSDCKDS